MKRYDVAPADVRGWLFLAAPKGLRLAEMRDGSHQIGHLETLLRKAIEASKIDVVSLDPFVKLHKLPENDNGAMDYVCDLLATIAIDHNCATDAPHHTNKGLAVAGNANSGRGASSIKDAGRLVFTLAPIIRDEAKTFGVSEFDRKFLVRLDSAKVNITPPARDAKWFKLVGVPLNNGTPDYPKGDEVQTVEPWSAPATFAGTSVIDLNAALTEIDAGLPNGQRYSDAPAADTQAAWKVVQKHCPDKADQQCKEIIKTWITNKVLTKETYSDPTDWKDRTGLKLDQTKRPS